MEALTLNLINNVMCWCQESKYKRSHHGFAYQIQLQSEKDYFLANLYLICTKFVSLTRTL